MLKLSSLELEICKYAKIDIKYSTLPYGVYKLYHLGRPTIFSVNVTKSAGNCAYFLHGLNYVELIEIRCLPFFTVTYVEPRCDCSLTKGAERLCSCNV